MQYQFNICVNRITEENKERIVCVLVRSGCYNKIPQTRQLINNRYLFLRVLEAGKSQIKAPAWSHSGGGPLRGS